MEARPLARDSTAETPAPDQPHSHVVFAKQQHPTLLFLAALIVLAGGYYWVEEADMHGYSLMYAAVVALVLVCVYFCTSKTQMMAKFAQPEPESWDDDSAVIAGRVLVVLLPVVGVGLIWAKATGKICATTKDVEVGNQA